MKTLNVVPCFRGWTMQEFNKRVAKATIFIAQPPKGKTMAKINKPRVATDTSLLVFGHNRGAGI